MKATFTIAILTLITLLDSANAQVKKNQKKDASGEADNKIGLTRTDHSFSNQAGFFKQYQFSFEGRTHRLDYRGSNVAEIVKNNLPASKEMRKFTTKRTLARISAIASPLCIIGAGYQFITGTGSPFVLFGCSAGFGLAKMILHNHSGRNLERAVSLYNQDVENKGKTTLNFKFAPLQGNYQGKSVFYSGLSVNINF